MRWNDSVYVSGKTSRIYYCFLFLPRRIGAEWRWLEFCNIEQSLFENMDGGRWMDVAWGYDSLTQEIYKNRINEIKSMFGLGSK
jgi:hypothetical protein